MDASSSRRNAPLFTAVIFLLRFWDVLGQKILGFNRKGLQKLPIKALV